MSVVISGIGAATPVGLHADATCAALRGGLVNVNEILTYFVTGEVADREPMIGGRVPTEWLTGEPEEEEWPGHERFGVEPPPPLTSFVEPGIERVLELLRIAATEVRSRAALGDMSADQFRVYVGVNEGDSVDLVRDELRSLFGGDPARFAVDPSGRAAGLALLRQAMDDLAAGRCSGALLGGIDSLLRAPVAARIDAQRRLKSDTEPQGMIPGEASAFVYLESEASARARGCEPIARVCAAAIGEEQSAGRDETNKGTGLAEAVRACRGQAPLSAMPLIVCDLNGERPRALEWALAATRALGDLEGDVEVWHPADSVGDPGAAAGVLNLLWAAVAHQRGYATTPRTLIWGASDGALRGAAIVEGCGS